MSKPKKNIFVRKFSVPGNTIQECKHFPCKKLYDEHTWSLASNYGHRQPCIVQMTEEEWEEYRAWVSGLKIYGYAGYFRMSHCYNDRKVVVRDVRMCPYKEQLGKPKAYIVAEKVDGTIVCDCPAGKFKRDENGNTTCAHRYEAYTHPKKYEIPVEATAKDVDTINAL
jgi:hypothetical protein